jgi:hypothetical protein
MKILRSMNRRGFSVGTAGWFTVLRPNHWFPASRLPETRRHFSVQATAVEAPQEHPDTQLAAPQQIMKPGTEDRVLMHPVLSILMAIAIAWGLLWWIIESQYH